MRAAVGEFLKNRWLIFFLRLALGGILLAASVSKLQQQAEFINVVINYGVLPDSLARAYGLVIPWAELFIGCSLILGIFPRFSAAVTIPLVISFVVASSYALVNPISSSCGCFGEVISLSHPVALSLDAIMLALALELLFYGSRGAFLSLGHLLDRFSPDLKRRQKFILEKLGRLAAIALAMVVVALIIMATRNLSGAESISTAEFYDADVEASLRAEIDAALGQGMPALLYFYFEGCSECEAVKPIIDELEQEYESRIAFMHVDYAEVPQAVRAFGVKSTPTIILITGKNEAGQYIGYCRFEIAIDKETLQDSFEQALRSRK